MIDLSKDTDSLSNFKQNSGAFMEKLKQTGKPVVLTVHGKPELILQDVESYQKMVNDSEFVKAVQSLRSSLKDIQEGRTFPAEDVLDELFEKYDLQR